jgi:UDP-2-acetamido-3-amino-2,3-dideoxy-glucuronate N-acetyltransferase
VNTFFTASTGEQPITDGNEGLRVLRVLKASQRSLDAKGTPFQLVSTSQTDRDQLASTAQTDISRMIGGDRRWGLHREGDQNLAFFACIEGINIGAKCNIGQNVVVGPDVNIGNACKIQNNVSVYKGVTLEDGVFCGPSMVFTNIYNPVLKSEKWTRCGRRWSNRGRR